MTCLGLVELRSPLGLQCTLTDGRGEGLLAALASADGSVTDAEPV